MNVVSESSRVMSIGSTSVDAILYLSPGFLLGGRRWTPEEDIKSRLLLVDSSAASHPK